MPKRDPQIVSYAAGVLRKSQFAGARVVFDENGSKQQLASQSLPEPVVKPQIKYKKLAASVLLQA